MPLIGDIDAYRAGSTAVTALYAGSVKVWPLGAAPETPFNAQDDQLHRVMLWDHHWADVPEYPGSALVAVTLSPVYRQVSVAGNSTSWIDAASVAHPVISLASGTNLTEGELIALVDGPGVRLYTRYGMFFVKSAA